MMGICKCKNCKQGIRWIRQRNGKFVPCDPAAVEYWPTPNGPDLLITGDGEYIKGSLTEIPGVESCAGFVPHFVTCPAALPAGKSRLTLPIKKRWFDMILSGEKKEEYRQLSDYWKTRFRNIGLLDGEGNPTGKEADIYLRNGYSSDAPTAKIRCGLKIDRGRQEWGAWCFTCYYVLTIKEVYAAA